MFRILMMIAVALGAASCKKPSVATDTSQSKALSSKTASLSASHNKYCANLKSIEDQGNDLSNRLTGICGGVYSYLDSLVVSTVGPSAEEKSKNITLTANKIFTLLAEIRELLPEKLRYSRGEAWDLNRTRTSDQISWSKAKVKRYERYKKHLPEDSIEERARITKAQDLFQSQVIPQIQIFMDQFPKYSRGDRYHLEKYDSRFGEYLE